MDEVRNPLPLLDVGEEVPEAMEEELKDGRGQDDE